MKLTAVITVANNNATSTDPTTVATITVYDRTEGESVFYTQTELKTKNSALGAYTVIEEYFEWLSGQSLRNKLELEFVCKDNNTNSSLMKMCKTYYLLRNTWKARQADWDRQGYGVREKAKQKVLTVHKILTANHKADDNLIKIQRELVILFLEGLTRKFEKGFDLWVVSLTKLWKDEENEDLRKWVKEEMSTAIKESGLSTGIKGIKKYKKSTKNAGSTATDPASQLLPT